MKLRRRRSPSPLPNFTCPEKHFSSNASLSSLTLSVPNSLHPHPRRSQSPSPPTAPTMVTMSGSVLRHSGFHDLLELVISTPSRLGLVSAPAPPVVSEPDEVGGWRYEDTAPAPAPESRAPASPPRGAVRGKDKEREKDKDKNGDLKGRGELRYRRVDKRSIGPPTNFRHIFHASTYEEATELLLRWSIEGVENKLGDPSWSEPIKDLVKARAREQQARAVAAVVEASRQSRMLPTPSSPTNGRTTASRPFPKPGQLHVVNGMPSSIYSTMNTTIVSPMLRAGTPALIAGLTPSRLEARLAAAAAPSTGWGGPESSPSIQDSEGDGLPNPFDQSPTATAPVAVDRQLKPAQLPSAAASSTEAVNMDHAEPKPSPVAVAMAMPVSMPKISADKSREELEAIAREIAGLPMTSTTVGDLGAIVQAGGKDKSQAKTGGNKSPRSVPLQQQTVKQTSKADSPGLPFRVIKPSLATLEKSMSVALFFEQFYHALLRPGVIGTSNPHTKSDPAPPSPLHAGNYVLSRARRLAELESSFLLPENRNLSESEKQAARDALGQEESRALRERRRKVDVRRFDVGRVIGHGAFGVVRVAREKESGRLVAMKQLRKADMLRKAQEGHVRAEKDLLAAAASQSGGPNSSWIVKLFYAFQDADHLYLVLEYMGGGDLLNLLVERDTFPESMTRFYVAEMILALEQTHALGYIHRDIKPDNFLFTPQGHIRVSDFGLATDLHWAHDTTYYEVQRKELLKRHGIYLEDSGSIGGRGAGKTRRMKKSEVERIMGKEWVEKGGGVLSWRDKNRKKLAYSVCGTNSYMAPEVIRGQGYGFSCDWWSLGIIMYESLYGYPPFSSSSRHVTRQKILDWRNTLRFPTKPRLSTECTDLMTRLLCEPEDRLGASPIVETASGFRTESGFARSNALGSDGAEKIKAHPWFAGLDWNNLHKATPPYQPDLRSDDDTRHFDDDIPDEPLAPANGAAPDATKDPMLGDKVHGAHLLEIRKSLAFKGWTFKALPKSSTEEGRYGHLARISSGGGGDDGEDGAQTPRQVYRHGGEETGESLDEYHDAVDLGAGGAWGVGGGGGVGGAGAGGAGGAGGTMNSVISGAGTVRSRALSM